MGFSSNIQKEYRSQETGVRIERRHPPARAVDFRDSLSRLLAFAGIELDAGIRVVFSVVLEFDIGFAETRAEARDLHGFERHQKFLCADRYHSVAQVHLRPDLIPAASQPRPSRIRFYFDSQHGAS